MSAGAEEPALRPWLSSRAPSAPAMLRPLQLTLRNAGPRYPALIRPHSPLPLPPPAPRPKPLITMSSPLPRTLPYPVVPLAPASQLTHRPGLPAACAPRSRRGQAL